MATAKYVVLVDWNNDGFLEEAFFITPYQPIPSGDDEDVSAWVRSAPGIDTVRGKDQIRALAPVMAGRADMELDNQDRTFSPENSASLLYGNLIPGRKVQIRAVYGSGTYYLWTGFLDDIPQHPARDRKAVSLPSLGPFSQFAGKKISTALYQSIRTDEAIGYILDALGWPAADRSLSTGQTTLNFWWLQEEDAFTALQTLVNTEGPGAVLYEDGEGNIVFEDRHYRMTTTRATTAQATISDTGSEPLHSEPFSYNPGLKDIINVAEVTVKTRAVDGSYSVVWSLGEAVSLAASEVRKYVATDTDPFTDAQTPVNATDYTVSAGSLSSVTLDRTSGQSCTLTLTAGASGATVTGLQLRAKSAPVTNTTAITNTVDASASITNYGRQVYTSSIRNEIDSGVAQDLVNALVSRYQDPRPIVTISLNNAVDGRMTQILSRQISDRITIVEAQTAVNHDYWVERIRHRIDEAGYHHVVEFGCEKVTSGQYAVWGSAVWGTAVWGY